jgi:hypothetical protein
MDEFIILLSAFLLLHGATFVIALLIYWKQQAFNKVMFAKVEDGIAQIKVDMRKPEVYQEVGKGIAQEVGRSVMAQIRSQMGNLARWGGEGQKGSGPMALLTLITGKGSMKKRISEAAGVFYGQNQGETIQVAGQQMDAVQNDNGRGSEFSGDNKPSESKMKEYLDYCNTLIPDDIKAKMEAKRLELAKM